MPFLNPPHWVPRPVMGYPSTAEKSGMYGEVGTHASPVSGHLMLRRHPLMGITVSLPRALTASVTPSTSGACFAMRASSPIVRPWTYGTLNAPTKVVVHWGSSVG